MLTTERPRLRPHVRRTLLPSDPEHAYLEDLLGLCDEPQRLTLKEASWLDLLDGERSLVEIHRAAGREFGAPPSLEMLAHWVERLDEGLLLDTPRFRQIAEAPLRPARHAGGYYAAEPDGLRHQLEGYFTQRGGP